jgi:hypothetical protein
MNEARASKEFAAFTEMLATKFAAIAEVAAKFTKRLSAEDRDALFDRALDLGFACRGAFDPQHESVAAWFEQRLQEAACERETWSVLHVTGWHQVKGTKLRNEP